MAFREQTIRQMQQKGWQFGGEGSSCRDCQADIFWGVNPATGRNVSFTAGTTRFHFKECGAAPVRTASQIPQPQRDDRRGSAVRPLQDGPGRYQQRAAESAPADHDLKEAVDDLAHAMRANTAALQALMQARKAAAAPAPAATRRTVVHKTGPDSEPYDEYHDEPYSEHRGN